MEFYSQWSSNSCSRRIEIAVQQALEEICRDSFEDDLTSTRPLIMTYYPLHRPVHNEAPMEFMEVDENPNYVFAPGNSEKNILVSWEPAPSPFVKVNTDGASKGNPGPSACGGVFRLPFGTFLGAFSLSLGIQTSYYAKLMAVFQAADIAETESWSHLWIESDSTYVINGIQKKHIDAPAQLKNRWNIFLQQMEFMKIKCSHILREGNKVADALANLGLKYQGLQLWDNPPEEIRKLLLDDACGHPNFRNS